MKNTCTSLKMLKCVVFFCMLPETIFYFRCTHTLTIIIEWEGGQMYEMWAKVTICKCIYFLNKSVEIMLLFVFHYIFERTEYITI